MHKEARPSLRAAGSDVLVPSYASRSAAQCTTKLETKLEAMWPVVCALLPCSLRARRRRRRRAADEAQRGGPAQVCAGADRCRRRLPGVPRTQGKPPQRRLPGRCWLPRCARARCVENERRTRVPAYPARGPPDAPAVAPTIFPQSSSSCDRLATVLPPPCDCLATAVQPPCGRRATSFSSCPCRRQRRRCTRCAPAWTICVPSCCPACCRRKRAGKTNRRAAASQGAEFCCIFLFFIFWGRRCITLIPPFARQAHAAQTGHPPLCAGKAAPSDRALTLRFARTPALSPPPAAAGAAAVPGGAPPRLAAGPDGPPPRPAAGPRAPGAPAFFLSFFLVAASYYGGRWGGGHAPC